MNDSELFNESVQDHGGEAFPPGLMWKMVLEQANRITSLMAVSNPRMPRIYTGCVDNNEINAFAFRNRESDGSPWRYFIGITSGTLVQLRSLFDWMLSDRRILPAVGDPAKEIEPFAVSPFPKCFDRRVYSDCLFLDALSFLIVHEATHIRHGHVDYLDDALGLRRVVEKQSQESELSEDTALLLQSVEMDADSEAGHILIGNLKSRPDVKWAYPADQRVYRAAFAMYFIFRTFGEKRFIGLSREDHPPALLRRLLSVVWATRQLNAWGEEGIGAIGSLMGSWFAVDQAFAILEGVPYSPEASMAKYAELQGPLGRAYYSALAKHWDTIARPLLAQVSYRTPLPLYGLDS